MSPLVHLLQERKLLLEKKVYDFLLAFPSSQKAVSFLERLELYTGSKLVTPTLLSHAQPFLLSYFSSFSSSERAPLEQALSSLGISLTLPSPPASFPTPSSSFPLTYRIDYASTKIGTKLEVQDFVGHFRNRYMQLQRILMQRPDLHNLIALNKLGSERSQVSVIGIVSEKKMSKKGNLIITLEDLTGKLPVVFRLDKPELAQKVGNILLDDVIAVKGSGNKDFLFASSFYFPDSFLPEKKTFSSPVSLAFISDLHCGSNRHLGKSLHNFITWLGSDDPKAKSIRFLFISGDTVDGVGVFPGQEFVLAQKSLRQQYELLASYLSRVPKSITMFLCPGQHDASRVAEPQPPPLASYAAPLYALENLILVTNPTYVTLCEGTKEFKVLMYHGASIHSLIHEIPELRLGKAHRTPAKAVKHMLQRRHLAPTHSEVTYIPCAERDPLVISEVPDVLCTGEVHRLDIESYNGVLIITGSCWQGQTPFEEKVGNIPDPCKVPVLSLDTRELKIYDFSDPEELALLGGTHGP